MSRWNKDIEISDDEDEQHPNIDPAYLNRLRHDTRVQKQEEKEQVEKEILKRKKALEDSKKELDDLKGKLSPDEIAAKEKNFDEEAQRLSELEKDFSKHVSISPWNVDTICKEGFSKTVINAKPKPQVATLTVDEICKRTIQFEKENQHLVDKFGMLSKFEDSKKFLEENPKLVCGEAVQSLRIACFKLAVAKKFDLMDQVSKQCISMQFLLQISKQYGRDPRECLPYFYTKISNMEEKEYKQLFDNDVESLRKQIRKMAEEKIKEVRKEAEKEREEELRKAKEARLGPGGLDPVEVLQSLPEALRKAFEEQDMPMLQSVLGQMPEDVMKYHMKRCEDSGLWCSPSDDED